ncbi:phosphorylated adapter RNA export protein [Procambarus clarkii]|uniref:phosphorylated adapter RNA export protein n=1 Tax=Procambarus clarkii TaxID=6728 RepID=UPI003744235D
MDDKEEGEVSDGNDEGFDLAYKPVTRPDSSHYRHVARHMPSSDEEYSSDSDSDTPMSAKRKRPNISKMDTCYTESHDPKGWAIDNATNEARQIAKPRRRNNIWSTVMEEQDLSREIGGFGLKRRLDQGDRNVESYDYTQALKARGIELDDSAEEEEEGEEEHEDNEQEDENEDTKKKRLNRKRHVKERIGYKKTKTKSGQRNLVDVCVTEGMTDEEVGHALAVGLMERKPELIVRVVEVLGREKAVELYRQTQTLEREGGLMIMNGSRRRTSGGVYLQLLKNLPSIEKADMLKIFPQEDSSQQWRKRKRAHRKRERHESKPQGEDVTEEGLHLGGLFSDDPGGAKCPGSTPVTSPQPSDNEEEDLAGSLINQLSPSALPDLVSISTPPVVADPRTCKPDSSLDTFNGGFLNVQGDPRAAKLEDRTAEVYDEDFLDIHTTDEMELF